MKSSFVTVFLVVAVTAAANGNAVVTTAAPVGVEVGGRIVEMHLLRVTVGASARAASRTLNYYVFDEWVKFTDAYSFCKSFGWNLATPKSAGDQETLEAAMAKSKLPIAWIGAACSSGRWTWLSDKTPVTYNNFPGNPLLLPPCAGFAESHALFILGEVETYPIDQWYTWGMQQTYYLCPVICQD